MVFFRSLRDSKSLQVSRTLLSILFNLINAVVWMVSTRPLMFKSSCPWINPLSTVPRAPITISITVTFMFSFLARSRYISFISLSLTFTQSQQFCKFSSVFFSFLNIIRSARLAMIRWSVCFLKSQSIIEIDIKVKIIIIIIIITFIIIYSLDVFTSA